MEPLNPVNPFAAPLSSQTARIFPTSRRYRQDEEPLDVRGAAQALGAVLAGVRAKGAQDTKDDFDAIRGQMAALVDRQVKGEDVASELDTLLGQFKDDAQMLSAPGEGRRRELMFQQLQGETLAEHAASQVQAAITKASAENADTLVGMSSGQVLEGARGIVDSAIASLSGGLKTDAARAVFDERVKELRSRAYTSTLQQFTQLRRERGVAMVDAQVSKAVAAFRSGDMSVDQIVAGASMIHGQYKEFLGDSDSARQALMQAIERGVQSMEPEEQLKFLGGFQNTDVTIEGQSFAELDAQSGGVIQQAATRAEDRLYSLSQRGRNADTSREAQAWLYEQYGDQYIQGDRMARMAVIQQAQKDLGTAGLDFHTAEDVLELLEGWRSTADNLGQAESTVFNGLMEDAQIGLPIDASRRAGLSPAQETQLVSAQRVQLAAQEARDTNPSLAFSVNDRAAMDKLFGSIGSSVPMEVFADDRARYEAMKIEADGLLASKAATLYPGQAGGAMLLSPEEFSEALAPLKAEADAMRTKLEAAMLKANTRETELMAEVNRGALRDLTDVDGLTLETRMRLQSAIDQYNLTIEDRLEVATSPRTYREFIDENEKDRQVIEGISQDQYVEGLRARLAGVDPADFDSATEQYNAYLRSTILTRDTDKLRPFMLSRSQQLLEVRNQVEDGTLDRRSAHEAFLRSGVDYPGWATNPATNPRFTTDLEKLNGAGFDRELSAIAEGLGIDEEGSEAILDKFFRSESSEYRALSREDRRALQLETGRSDAELRRARQFGVPQELLEPGAPDVNLVERRVLVAMNQRLVDLRSDVSTNPGILDQITQGNVDGIELSDDVGISWETARLANDRDTVIDKWGIRENPDRPDSFLVSERGKQAIRNLSQAEYVDDPLYLDQVIRRVLDNIQ